MLKDVLDYLPEVLKIEINNLSKEKKDLEEKIEEIRLRANQKLTLKVGQEKLILNTRNNKRNSTRDI